MDPWSQMITAAVETVSPRLVSVAATDPEESRVALATGLCLDDRHVVTHARVCSPKDRITVDFHDGDRLEADLVASDPLYLLAVLRLRGRCHAAPLELAAPAELTPGVLCLALGRALPADTGVALGVISAAHRTVYRPERFPVDGLLFTDAAVRIQDIGGPLVTLEARLLGINVAPASGGVASAVGGPVVARLVDQILRHGKATHPWLGFSGQTDVVSRAMAALLAVPPLRGVAVSGVVSGGPGDRAGIRVLDLVVRADGRDVDTVGGIRGVLADHRLGEAAVLTVLRGGQFCDLEMPVEEIPRLSKASDAPN